MVKSRTILLVAGTLDEAYAYIRSQYPGLRLLRMGKSVYAEDTRYYLVLRRQDLFGWAHSTPVVLYGTCDRHEWIDRVWHRFAEVTRAPSA